MGGNGHKENGFSRGAAALPRVISRGAVTNLEEHVGGDWWRNIFTSLYLMTDGDVVDDEQITQKEVSALIESLELRPEHAVLDLCCGQGRHLVELARRGFHDLNGLDRSHYLVHKARATAKKRRLAVKFREGDARKLPYPADHFHVVLIMGNSFGYFETVQDDLRILKEIHRVLKPWGKLFIDLADGEYLRGHFRKRSWEWISPKMFVCRERSLSIDGQRLVSREVATHIEKGVVADHFYAERLYTRDSIADLLSRAGFRKIRFDPVLKTESLRGQDLGMMEARLGVFASVRKAGTESCTGKQVGIRNVVVLLGDAEKTDRIKPGQVFDEDDRDTIDRMKRALSEIPGYRFTFLSNHDTLVRDLCEIALKGDCVFNLCDEGYQNDARKELHIPALLEILGIPYTGSGPQCLASCYDKSLVRGVAEEMGIPVPVGVLVRPEDSLLELPFDFPVIVKPNFGDSSFGITAQSVAVSAEELLNAVSQIREGFGYDKPILVESFLTGSDLSVGIIGNAPSSYTVLPLIEEDYSKLPPDLPEICGYEAKWRPESPYWKVRSRPAKLPEKIERNIVRWSVELAERLECRDYVRMDWRLDAGGSPRLLEVNPNPGWCWDGHLAKMAAAADVHYSAMLKNILAAAESRLGMPALQPRDSGDKGLKAICLRFAGA
jgi:D-alanine-D-alanine ligase